MSTWDLGHEAGVEYVGIKARFVNEVYSRKKERKEKVSVVPCRVVRACMR